MNALTSRQVKVQWKSISQSIRFIIWYYKKINILKSLYVIIIFSMKEKNWQNLR